MNAPATQAIRPTSAATPSAMRTNVRASGFRGAPPAFKALAVLTSASIRPIGPHGPSGGSSPNGTVPQLVLLSETFGKRCSFLRFIPPEPMSPVCRAKVAARRLPDRSAWQAVDMAGRFGILRITGLVFVGLVGVVTLVMTTSGLHVTKGDGSRISKTTVAKFDVVPGLLVMAVDIGVAWAIVRSGR
jgi:hypothetical protein